MLCISCVHMTVCECILLRAMIVGHQHYVNHGRVQFITILARSQLSPSRVVCDFGTRSRIHYACIITTHVSRLATGEPDTRAVKIRVEAYYQSRPH